MIICISNEKGGMLKTTLTCHIAHHLAYHLKKYVLLVDMDTQGNCSTFFSHRNADPETVRCSVSDFLGGIDPSRTSDHRISLLSGGDELSKLESFEPLEVIKALKRLRDVAGYDYILIDTPPSKGNSPRLPKSSAA